MTANRHARSDRPRRNQFRAFAKAVLVALGVYLAVAFCLDLLSLPPVAVGLISVAVGATVGTRASGVERTPNSYVLVAVIVVLVLALLTAGLWWLAGTTLAGRLVSG